MSNKLTQERLQELFEYKDGDLYWRVQNSNRIKSGDKVSPNRKEGEVVQVGVDGTGFKLHRLIYLYFNKDFDIHNTKIQIDHIDVDRNNNNIENLRVATNKENNCNRKMQNNNTSGYKGVTHYPEGRKKCWLGYYKVDGKMYSKYFLTKEEAIEFSVNNRKHYHGDFFNENYTRGDL